MDIYSYKLKLKNALIIINAFLSLMILMLLLFGIFIIQPKQIQRSILLQQYLSFDLSNIIKNTDVSLTKNTTFKNIKNTKEESASKLSLEQKDHNNSTDLDLQNIKHDNTENLVIVPRVSIIVGNLGNNKSQTDLAISLLPKNIALGFLPYSKTLRPFLEKAKDKGHEIYLNIPIQIENYYSNNYTLNTGIQINDNINILNNMINDFQHYQGMYISFIPKNNEEIELIKAISDSLNKNKLLFISTDYISYDNKYVNLPNIIYPSVFIDDYDESTIKSKLDILVRHAIQNKKAVCYIHGYVNSINILKQWLEKVDDIGIKIVPISQLIN